MFFFFNDTATTEIYTLSLHDALPILLDAAEPSGPFALAFCDGGYTTNVPLDDLTGGKAWIADEYEGEPLDRKSTRLNSSHANISYAVFCLKKKHYPRP